MRISTEDLSSTSFAGPSLVNLYLREIRDAPLLSSSDERRLARLVADGDPEARDLMIRSNLRLVVNVSRHYLGRGLGIEDLIEEGNLGLMRAVESYDPDAATRFSTYAVYWIKQSMRRAIMNQARAVRLPAYLVNLLAKWHRASACLTERLERVPTDDEVAAALKLTKRKHKLALWALEVARAMPGGQESSTASEFALEEMVSDSRSRSVEDQVHHSDCLQRIFRGIDLLDPLEARVVRLRFGLTGAPAMSLQEVAEVMGITRERVRHVERRALARLTSLSRHL
ncbi:sigma-70 family RNA polymerase sigma factor [bacterium]|nr:sigma-70 family RNA polymerase sigma factor [bacterium]